MRQQIRRWVLASLTTTAAALLAACGGGGADTTPATSISRVTVMGDSLADVGTFGLKFTVQGAGVKIYPELVAQSYGIASQCPYFVFTGTTFAANTTAGCSNYAIGGAVINPSGSGYGATDPRGIVVQLQAAAATGHNANDLLLIDGGGNDAAALVSAYLATATGGNAAIGRYQTLLTTVLDATTVGTQLAAGASGFANVGGLYMTALADRFADQITTYALGAGAQRVALLNMPGITNTPRFQTVLDSIGASAGAEARAQSQVLFDGWVGAFNARLAQRFAGNAKVVVVDFYTSFNDEVAHPAQYQLTNATTPVCPITGVGSDGLPTYTFATCTETALSTSPPEGQTGADWWQRYAFSDSFHPTPYGHQLLAQLISRSLAQAGWL